MIDVIRASFVEHGVLLKSFDWCACLALNIRHSWQIRTIEDAALVALLCSTSMHVVMASMMSSLMLFHRGPAASVPCPIFDTIQQFHTVEELAQIRGKDVAIDRRGQRVTG